MLRLLQLLSMVSQPVKAVVLLFPISAVLESKRLGEDAKIAKDGQPPIDPTVFWIKQTVRVLAAAPHEQFNDYSDRSPTHAGRSASFMP